MKKNFENLILISNKFFFPFYNNKNIKILFKNLENGEPKGKRGCNVCRRMCKKFLQSKKIEDIDIATIFTPDEIKKKLKKYSV